MKNQPPEPPNASELRQRAEQRLQARHATTEPALSEADARALVREMQILQIELELQNEELHRTQVEARQAADKYTGLFDFAPVAYFVLDSQGQIREVNLMGAVLLGFDRQRVTGQALEQYVGLDSRAEFRRFCASMARGEGRYFCELRLLRHGDDPCDVLVEGIVAAGEPGENHGCRLTMSNITERKRAEEKLRQFNAELERRVTGRTAELQAANDELRTSEERLRLVLQASALGTFEVDLGTGEGHWNAQEYALLGLQPGDAPGNAETWFRHVHPDDLGLVRAEWEAALRSGQLDVEFRIVRADGAVRWMAGRGEFIFADPAGGDPPLPGRGQAVRFLGVNFDITPRKQAEEALRASEERFRLALKNSPVSVAVQDRDLVYRWAYNQPGRPTDEIIGCTDADLFEPEAVPALLETKRRVLATGAEAHMACWLTSNGTRRFLNLYYEPTRNPAGEITGIGMAAVDLTTQKLAEEALRTSGQFNKAVLNSLPAHIAVLDREGNILSVNARWQQFALENGGGSAPALGEGVNYLAVCRRASQQGDALAQAALDGIQAVLAWEKPGFQLEYPCHSPAQERWFLLQVTPVASKAGRVILSHLDVTERHQALAEVAHVNQRLQAIMQAVPVGVSYSDDLTCQHVTGNPAVLAQFEVAVQDNLSASAPDAAAPGRQVQFFREGRPITDAELPLQRAVAEKTVIPPMELEVVLPSGRRWFAEASGAPIRDGTGNVIGGVAVTVDLSARKQAEARVRESEARFRRVFDHAATGIALTDCTGRFVRCNAAYSRLTGYSMAELDELAFPALLHPEDRADNLGFIRRLLAGELPSFEIENRYLHKNGSTVWVHKHVSLLGDDRGQPAHIVALVTDTTERRRIEDTLRFLVQCGASHSGESFFRELARYLARTLGMDFVCVDRLEAAGLTARTLAMFHGGEFQDNVSYALKDTPCGDVVGRTICCFPNEVRRRFPQDSLLQDLQAESYLGATLWSSQGQPIGLIAVIGRQPLANPRPAEAILQLAAVRAAGELERQQAEAALAQSEARYRAIGESIDYGVWVCDPAGRNTYASESFLKLVGLTQAQCSNFGWGDVLHPADAARTIAAWQECTRTGGTWDIEHRFRGVDGQYHDVLARGVAVRNERGEIVCWAGINLDISRLKRAEAQLKASLHEQELLLQEIHHSRKEPPSGHPQAD